jgi:hypothetical protein
MAFKHREMSMSFMARFSCGFLSAFSSRIPSFGAPSDGQRRLSLWVVEYEQAASPRNVRWSPDKVDLLISWSGLPLEQSIYGRSNIPRLR